MLVNLKEVLELGRKQGIAVGAINTPNLETLIAAIEVAEEKQIPLIVAHAPLHETVMSIDYFGPIMIQFAKAAKVPVCVHLDHGENFEQCKKAIDMGFTGVMMDASSLPYEANIAVVKEVVEYAHKRNVGVEAELGCLPNRESGGVVEGDPSRLYTDPKLVPDFVKKTGVDALAIAFGTAHGIYYVNPVLSLDVIKNCRAASDVFLVMHGGSGLKHEDYTNAIKCGVTKINYYTYMSYHAYAAVKKHTDLVATGYYHDLAKIATEAEKEKLREILHVFTGR